MTDKGPSAHSGDRASMGGGRRGRLERTLGLREALTIGLGTMVGAGIFVFPGLAVEAAGPAAALSFAVGAAVALLVALPTSELATGMPRSGGGYYFISRSLGGLAGVVVGLGQWLGLVFASAFYLAGFGHYLVDVLGRLGLPSGLSPAAIGCAAAVGLTAVAIAGTRTSGRLQYVTVAVLITVLAAFLAWGTARATGLVGASSFPDRFAPRGATPIFTTAALVFTSYLGFAQIANLAGEVREPSRTLPRAMLGSVVLVGLLYVVTILVSTSVLGTEAMAEAGETALTEVGRTLLGRTGAMIIGLAGLLATLSSANASILSSSRAAFALSRDRVIPEAASRVSRRFRTPHVALVLTGTPVALLALLGRIEVLAEVASILHLIMYGLMCVAAIVLRRKDWLWYRPTFRAPMSPWLPGLGSVLCFALVVLMSPRALAWAGGVAVAAAAWFLFRARDIEVRGVEELAPAPELARANLLLQMELPDAPGMPEELVRALAPESVVLLGWVQVPEQSSAEQVQDELGEDVEDDLEEVAERLRELGMRVETELVFTGDLARTIDRMAGDRDPDAILSLRGGGSLERVLVALASGGRATEAAGYAARIALATGARIEVLPSGSIAEEEDEHELRRIFVEAGARTETLEIRSDAGGRGSAAARIGRAAEGADLIVLGSRRSAGEEEAFGRLQEKVTRNAAVPVLIARARRHDEAGGGS